MTIAQPIIDLHDRLTDGGMDRRTFLAQACRAGGRGVASGRAVMREAGAMLLQHRSRVRCARGSRGLCIPC
jgi:hypothetical protein